MPLLIAWILDRLLGDPSWLPHPIVAFGKAIGFCEHKLNRGKGRRVKGAFMALVLVGGVYALTFFFLRGVSLWSYELWIGVQAILIFYCLAGTTLIREVRDVFRAVDRSLDEGRKQVSRIVGRDTAELSAQEVRAAALETLAENLSDGVIAPLFWYALLGVPGMLAYKMVNTLDSMVGYRNERYRLFGCFSARLDDVANFLPARLTAFFMVLVSGRLSLLSFVHRYGRQHASPNSGYPESALAGILNCRFGGPHNYFGEEVWKPYIGENERPLTTDDMLTAVRINRRAEVLMVVLVLLVNLSLLIFYGVTEMLMVVLVLLINLSSTLL
ncbi:MAG: adenosylcobinamide-phosphate synthase CbiB [Bacteroides sp.]|nr:adenosylcobinamide-phosphate synthase CbiB [Bacteroides sp.]